MQLPQLVAFIGPEGAGKTTCARILEGRHDYVRLPLAGPLKAMLAAAGVPTRHLYGTPADKATPLDILSGNSARHAMQTLGTEWGRTFMGPGFWLGLWAAAAQERLAAGGRVVVDDARFPNEAARVRVMGGKVIRVLRSPADTDRKPRHASENFAALPFDATVINSGSMDSLAVALDTVLSPQLALAL